MAAWLQSRNPNARSVSKNSNDAGLLNRLDFETSGCLLAAKRREVWEILFGELKSGRICKEYLVIVQGLMHSQSIKSYIGSPYRRAKKVRCYPKSPLKSSRFLPAQADFQRLSYNQEGDASLVKVIAHSAKRHQIRAQASFLGHPLIGDSLYLSKRKLTEVCPEIVPPFFLHALRICFKHPITQNVMEVRAEPMLPQIFAKAKIDL